MLENTVKQNILNSFSKATTYKSVVGIIFNEKGQILLGKSNDKDDRNGKWCFIGGGIEEGEEPIEAIIRETKEEANINIKATYNMGAIIDSKPQVCFIKCKYLSGKLIHNHEYTDMNWFNLDALPKGVYPPNKSMIKELKSK